jgi:hypothetical protein
MHLREVISVNREVSAVLCLEHEAATREVFDQPDAHVITVLSMTSAM